MRPIYFNGKFYAGGLNGVHRVADRLIREFDAQLAALPPDERPHASVICTRKADWVPTLQAIEVLRDNAAPSQLWEQWRLPRLAADGVLVNLANLAPLRHPRQVILIHDVQFLFPDSGYPLRQRLGYKWLTPRMARGSARVLTVSEYSRKMLDLMCVADKERTRVLYNGADHILDAASPGPDAAPPDRPFVLMFGSPKPYKNNAVIFQAFADPALAGFDLVIVGAARESLAAAGLTPPANVRFAGSCDDAVLRSLYEQAHCFVFPSRTEGFGLPPVEAMLCRCPVIVAPAGAIPEVCRDAAIYADVDDPASWVAAILTLRAGGIRDEKIAAGLRRASAFQWEQAGRNLFAQVSELARQ